jgi:hypothetical protein
MDICIHCGVPTDEIPEGYGHAARKYWSSRELGKLHDSAECVAATPYITR